MSVVAADALLAKYDVAAPRYTSYPTVPCWERTPSALEWLERLSASLAAGAARPGLYVHIPFCRTLCTFCGCNTRVTRSHDFVAPYIRTLLAELDLYRARLGLTRLPLGELTFGGGTPTFLSVPELTTLLDGLDERVVLDSGTIASIEADPRVTSAAQLALLASYGFRRISFGVQDFDPRVQQIVNRVQSEQQVKEATDAARAAGFERIAYDLIYGLPLQTRASIELTLDAIGRLRPDRIALYGYAHVPWIRPGQRRFSEADLPGAGSRRALQELARERLLCEGYREIGLDHFALPGDPLWQARADGRLHRSFAGYSEAPALPLIGIGVSAIGDAGDAFAQNEKELQRYEERIARGELPIQRGHLLDAEDRVLRRHILRLTTQLATRWEAGEDRTEFLAQAISGLAEPATDGLVALSATECRVSSRGRPWLRTICMAFDARLARRRASLKTA